MNSETVLKIDNVWKSYTMGKLQLDALKGINLEINRGSFIAISGPSGSGKSTLLNILGCLDVPSNGKVFLMGQDITKLSENDLKAFNKHFGTKIIFEELKARQNKEEIIRKYIATQFNFMFSMKKNDKFGIKVNGTNISKKDLEELQLLMIYQ